MVIGELGLDGRVHLGDRLLPAVIGAVRHGYLRVVVPRANAGEASLVPGAEVLGVGSLAELCARLRGEPVEVEDDLPPLVTVPDPPPDLADVVGQADARHAMEVAAAGGHHVFLTGPPGVGKTMLAERLPGLLPDLGEDDALEVTSIHSLLGRLPAGRPLVTRPPFCAPHHTATVASLIGGGTGIPAPGTISLAHHGVLFVDEATEFERRTLDALRQPLESGTVTINRVGGMATYPSRFQLILAANPCPVCEGRAVDGSVELRVLLGADPGLPQPAVRAVARPDRSAGPAGADQSRHPDRRARPGSPAPRCASGSRRPAIEPRGGCGVRRGRRTRRCPGRCCGSGFPLPSEALRTLRIDTDRSQLSSRGVERVMKVAWTIADLAGHDVPDLGDVDAARSLRYGAGGGGAGAVGVTTPDEERIARAVLLRVAEPAIPGFVRHVRAVGLHPGGPATSVAGRRSGRSTSRRSSCGSSTRPGSGISKPPAGWVPGWSAPPMRSGRPGWRIWSAAMRTVSALWVRGPLSLRAACERAVAIVGTRARPTTG